MYPDHFSLKNKVTELLLAIRPFVVTQNLRSGDKNKMIKLSDKNPLKSVISEKCDRIRMECF